MEDDRRSWLRSLRFDIHGVPRHKEGSDWDGIVADITEQADRAGIQLPRQRRHSWFRRDPHDPAAVLNSLVATAFDLVQDAVRDRHGPTARAKLNNVKAVTLNADEPFARTSFHKDGPILLVSSAFMTTAAMFSEVATIVSNPAAPAAEFGASVATVRFLTVQQICFGLSAIHSLQRPSSANLVAELFFAVAHETAHILLEHPATAEGAAARELEADLFAWDLLIHQPAMTWLTKPGHAAVISLLVAGFSGTAGYARRPSTHPTTDERVETLAAQDRRFAQAAQQLHPATTLIHRGMDIRDRFTPSVWDDLINSRKWETSLRPAAAYSTTRVLAQVLSADEPELRACLSDPGLKGAPSFRDAITTLNLSPHAAWAALADAAVAIDPDWLTDGSPVHLGDLVAAFGDDACWGRTSSASDRIVLSTVAAALLARHLTNPTGGTP